jgi:hypothetical protein
LTPQGNLADAAIEDFRACTTTEEIEAVANKYRPHLAEIKADDAARFHHVVNAKTYYLKQVNL